MLDYLYAKPEYLFALVFCVFGFVWVIAEAIKESRNDDRNEDDDDGSELIEIPEWDLPPGVSLPTDKAEKERSLA